jgi:hypothetical protein
VEVEGEGRRKEKSQSRRVLLHANTTKRRRTAAYQEGVAAKVDLYGDLLVTRIRWGEEMKKRDRMSRRVDEVYATGKEGAKKKEQREGEGALIECRVSCPPQSFAWSRSGGVCVCGMLCRGRRDKRGQRTEEGRREDREEGEGRRGRGTCRVRSGGE